MDEIIEVRDGGAGRAIMRLLRRSEVALLVVSDSPRAPAGLANERIIRAARDAVPEIVVAVVFKPLIVEAEWCIPGAKYVVVRNGCVWSYPQVPISNATDPEAAAAYFTELARHVGSTIVRSGTPDGTADSRDEALVRLGLDENATAKAIAARGTEISRVVGEIERHADRPGAAFLADDLRDWCARQQASVERLMQTARGAR